MLIASEKAHKEIMRTIYNKDKTGKFAEATIITTNKHKLCATCISTTCLAICQNHRCREYCRPSHHPSVDRSSREEERCHLHSVDVHAPVK